MRFSKLSSVYECLINNSFYYLLRHNVLNKHFLLSESEFEDLKRNLKTENSKIPSELVKNHIVVPEDYSEDKFIDFIKRSYNLDEPHISIIYLTFSNQCNLACKYCYVEGSYEKKLKSTFLKKDVFEKTLKFLKWFITEGIKEGYVDSNLTVIFYGSEPLLTPEYLKNTVIFLEDNLKDSQVNLSFEIITNGTLITNEIIRFFKEHSISLAISLDGPKEINDQMRVFKLNQKGTFDTILKNVEKLKKEGVPFGISCTIAPHNIDHLKENILFFKEMGTESVGFNIYLEPKNKENRISVSILKANYNLLEASKFAQEQGIYEDRIQRKVKAFNRSTHPLFKDCGAPGNQIVIYPDGEIGICQAYLGMSNRPKLGSVLKKYSTVKQLLYSEDMKKWMKRHPLNMPECKYCPAIGICGGGCIFESQIKYRDIYRRDKAFCVHTQLTLDMLLKELLKKELGKNEVYISNISNMLFSL